MPAPIPFLGFSPPTDPGRLPVLVEQGGSGGGGGGGLTPNQIRGISIAFGSTPSTEQPLWQNILEMGNP